VARPGHLSHTALQRHRECPYRFLLADALGLRRVDPLEPAFGAPDLGNLAHAVMQAWLDPDGPAVAALAGGDTGTATRLLHAAADRARAAVGRDLPGSEVALRGLLALAPQLVTLETARLRAWRPAAVEATFRVTLGQVADWLAARRADAPPVPPSARDFPLHGQIDRVDVARDGAARAAVIDYKTGRLPARSHSRQGRALQVALYGLAVVAGAVEGLPSGPWELGEAGYYPLRGPDVDVAVHLDGDAALVAPAGMVLEQAMAILDPHTPLALVPDWQQEDARGELPCAHCEFAGVCRLQERDGSPPLAARVARLVTRARGGLA
jgi:RecB family exonuclease